MRSPSCGTASGAKNSFTRARITHDPAIPWGDVKEEGPGSTAWKRYRAHSAGLLDAPLVAGGVVIDLEAQEVMDGRESLGVGSRDPYTAAVLHRLKHVRYLRP